jgi:hypothetical protein
VVSDPSSLLVVVHQSRGDLIDASHLSKALSLEIESSNPAASNVGRTLRLYRRHRLWASFECTTGRFGVWAKTSRESIK